jgi:hypothetical protein
MPGLQLFYGAKPIFVRRSFRTAPALPKFISECGDVLLFGFVSDYGAGLPMLLLCVQVSLIGVLKDLSGAFMPGPVIFLSVVLGAGAMGVRSKVMVLGGYLLRFVHNAIASARVAPSVALRQTKAWPRRLVRKVALEVQDLLGACRFHCGPAYDALGRISS